MAAAALFSSCGFGQLAFGGAPRVTAFCFLVFVLGLLGQSGALVQFGLAAVGRGATCLVGSFSPVLVCARARRVPCLPWLLFFLWFVAVRQCARCKVARSRVWAALVSFLWRFLCATHGGRRCASVRLLPVLRHGVLSTAVNAQLWACFSLPPPVPLKGGALSPEMFNENCSPASEPDIRARHLMGGAPAPVQNSKQTAVRARPSTARIERACPAWPRS